MSLKPAQAADSLQHPRTSKLPAKCLLFGQKEGGLIAGGGFLGLLGTGALSSLWGLWFPDGWPLRHTEEWLCGAFLSVGNDSQETQQLWLSELLGRTKKTISNSAYYGFIFLLLFIKIMKY